MTAKEYLLQVRRASIAKKHCEERLDELRAQAGGLRAITYDKDKVQVSPSDTLLEAIVRLTEIEVEYGRRIVKYERTKAYISAQIDAMDDPVHTMLLTLRYVKETPRGRMIPLRTIADIMGYDYERLRHLHGEALEAFRKQYL